MLNKKNSLKILLYYVINVILLKLIKIFLRHYESDKWYSKEHIVVKNGIDVVISFKVRDNVYDKDKRYAVIKFKAVMRSYIHLLLIQNMSFRLCLGGGEGMEWNGIKRIFLEYSSLLLFESFNGGNGMYIPLFGSLSGREWNG